MLDIASLALDPQKSEEGTWIDYLEGSRLKVARDNNEAAERLRTQRILENAEVLQNAEKDPEPAEKLARRIDDEVMAYCILKDWEGFGSGEEEVAYTPEKGLEMFADDRFAEFRDHVQKIARNRDHYREQSVARATKAVKKQAGS